MLSRPLVRRLVSPSGFVLVGLLLLLPFVSASCDIDDGRERTSASAAYTGWDLVLGGAPSLGVSSTHDRTSELMPLLARSVPRIDVQPFAVVAVLLLVVGAVTGALRAAWPRALAGAAAAASAAVFLVGAVLDLRRELDGALRKLFTDYAGRPPAGRDLVLRLDYGFWLALAVLVALLLLNVVTLVRASQLSPPEPAVT